MAYCIDEAVWYAGMTIESELEGAGQKKGKEEGRATRAREAVLNKYFGEAPTGKSRNTKFADPASMF